MSLERTHWESVCLGKEGKNGVFLCVLLIKPSMKNFRISFKKPSFFFICCMISEELHKTLATRDKVSVVFASESHSSNN